MNTKSPTDHLYLVIWVDRGVESALALVADGPGKAVRGPKRITMTIYAHASLTEKRKALGKLGDRHS